MHYVEVILPLPIKGVFTYALSNSLFHEHIIGCRVIVPFGKRKIFTGVINKYLTVFHSKYQIKEVIDILDTSPILTENQLKFQYWLSEYYMCTLGEVYNASLPSGLKLTSDSFVALLPDVAIEDHNLSDKEFMVTQFLNKQELSTDEIKKLTGLKHPYRILKNLIDKNIVYLYEKVKDKYLPKKQNKIRISSEYVHEDILEDAINSLENKPKQQEVILTYLNSVPILEEPENNKHGIAKKDLLKKGISPSSLETLIKNGIMEQWEVVVDRFDFNDTTIEAIPTLSIVQQKVLQSIQSAFDSKNTTLLKGITGSGKTEIYIKLIQSVIEKGGTSLYLLPEIALTTQIIKRFKKYFGNKFGIYHSRFSDNERAETYKNCLEGKYDFIIGVRSAIFLPFKNLQLIIIDEEHEPSYKQYDPAPRYNARDAAIYLARIHDAKVLLGSATPSLESYSNGIEGKYGYVTLDSRYEDQPLPEIIFSDLALARKQRKIKGNFSNLLLDSIQNSIENNKQVILFQNRRGYAPYIQCNKCHHIPKCASCDVSLTYHIFQNQLVCHYCGFRQYYEPSCEACSSNDIKTVGVGTEQIEEELKVLMPDLKIKRMDLDTTRNKNSYQQIIDDFESGDIQVLIGTQMISKGLDFEHVNLVGVFDADRIINFPDFRSHERAFQLITQVSGRSGRKHERGKVIIQTNDPDQIIFKHIREGYLDLFYNEELQERERFKYPPNYRLIRIVIKHKDKTTAMQAAGQLQLLIKKELGEKRSFGPIEPVIGKIRNYYIYENLIKLEKKNIKLKAVKEFLMACRYTLLALPSFKSVIIHFDVDPL